jgi:lysosomal acid lipase/cholesteryl ester hydrolase
MANWYEIGYSLLSCPFFWAGEVFQAYDYGREGNLQRYGSVKPYEYDLTKITAPV